MKKQMQYLFLLFYLNLLFIQAFGKGSTFLDVTKEYTYNFTISTASYTQRPEKILFVIDSIPILQSPEEWNQLLQKDIADISIVKDKDSLKRLGWEEVDGITYIFTKAYRNRPDSIKKIPSLRQMKMQNAAWHLHGSPYSGKYIDYFNNGKIANEGTLVNGKLEGELIIYFTNGSKKIVAQYKDGVLNGTWNQYFLNGALMEKRSFIKGKENGGWSSYFINGRIENEKKPKRATAYDTVFTYYSTGKLKQMRRIINGVIMPDKKIDAVNYYTSKFNQSLNSGNLREANKSFFAVWKIDSASSDTYFMEGVLLMKEAHFNEAIVAFDKALSIEPLMREAFAHRGIAAIKRHKFLRIGVVSKEATEAPLTLEDLASMSKDQRIKICNDFQLAKLLNFNEHYLMKIVTLPILNFCEKLSSQ